MARKTINVEDKTHAQLSAMAGKTRMLTGVLEGLVDWAFNLDEDIRPLVLEGMTPAAEVRLLELLLERARERVAGRTFEVPDLSDDSMEALHAAVQRPDVRVLIAQVEAGVPMPAAARSPTDEMPSPAKPTKKAAASKSQQPPSDPNEFWRWLKQRRRAGL